MPRVFLATDPMGNVDRLEADVVETVVPHLLRGPRDRVVERCGARDPSPDPLGELGEPLPGDVGCAGG